MIRSRIEKIQKILSACPQATAIIVTSPINRRYLTDFKCSNAYIIILPDSVYFFTDSRYIEAAEKLLSGLYCVKLLADRKSQIVEVLHKSQIQTLRFESNVITLRAKNTLDSDFNEFNIEADNGLIENMRMIKDEEEINRITKAQEITDNTFSYIIPFISDNVSKLTECDLALEIEYYMRKNGADRSAFDIIAVSGVNSSRPHGEPSDALIHKGFLTMDYGAGYRGYCSDMTRTICIGKPDAEMIKVYETVLSAQKAALAISAAGIEGKTVDKAARDVIAEAGYSQYFKHGLGHSLGLEIHEPPSYSPMESRILPENTVVTVEPGIYIESRFGVRIEDLIVLKTDGYKNLTKSNKDLIVI